MRTLMSEPAWVHYGQIYVQGGDEYPDMDECFGGQSNGLCGAAAPGFLFLLTGLHTGKVGFAVALADEPPPVDESWQEIVEASFQPIGEVALVSWGGEDGWPLDLTAASYRVRYCATGMEEGRELDTRMDDEPEADRYLLIFWPAPPGPDVVVKQTSEIAAYWHEYARELPPPPTPEEKAAAEREALAEQRRAAEQAEIEAEKIQWGGRLPSEELRAAGGHAWAVSQLDRSLVDALVDTDPITQRKVACWVTRRAAAEAQFEDVDWIAAALDAMDRGEPLPGPFDGDAHDRRAWDRLLSDERIPRTVVTSFDGEIENLLQQAMAFPALFSAREPDPLRAALDALWNAAVAFGRDRDTVLFTEVRQAFPALA